MSTCWPCSPSGQHPSQAAQRRRGRRSWLISPRCATTPPSGAARAAPDRFENTYTTAFHAAVACFAEDREALLPIHWLSVRHRIRMRITDLAEPGFEEERPRTKVIPPTDDRTGHD